MTLPAPNIGIERYFFDVADMILARIKEHAQHGHEAERTGPIADVLYSAAGNSADDQYYRKGIIAYSFEAGLADLRVNQTDGRDHAHRRRPAAASRASAPPFDHRGPAEAFEFSDGNFGLLESALAVLPGRHPAGRQPRLRRRRPRATGAADQLPVHVAGRGGGHLLHDGRLDADDWPRRRTRTRARAGRARCSASTVSASTRQVDRRRHQGQHVGRADPAFLIGPEGAMSAARCRPTLSLSLGAPASFGPFTPGSTGYTRRCRPTSSRRPATPCCRSPTRARTTPASWSTVRSRWRSRCRSRRRAGRDRRRVRAGRRPASPTSLPLRRPDQQRPGVDRLQADRSARTDALRTGTYSKTLTFTLSTTQP